MMGSQLLAVIGIVVSSAFGIWGVVLGLRKRKYPGEITFIEERYINLFDDIVKNVGSLSILYKNKNISNNIILLKGHLINTGTKDISPDMIGRDLVAILPEGYKWIETKIFNCSPDLKTNSVIINNTTLKFKFGLFRCKEYCSFETLVEVPIDDNKKEKQKNKLQDKIVWSHRIADTKSIKKQNIPTTNKNKKIVLLERFQFGFMAIAAISMLIFSNFIVDEKIGCSLFYEITNEANKSIEVQLLPQNDQFVLIKERNGEFKKKLKLSEFNNKYSPDFKIKTSKYDKFLLNGIFLFMLIASFIMIGVEVKRSYKARRFLKLVDFNNDILSCKEPKESVSKLEL